MDKPSAIEARYRNGILAALPITEIESLRPHLDHMTLVSGQVLHEPDRPIMDIFFVDEGIVSLAANTNGNGQCSCKDPNPPSRWRRSSTDEEAL